MTTDYGVNAGWYEALKRKAEAAERLAEACAAVDELWGIDSLVFPEEMNMESPVGKVWSQVRAALQAWKEIK